MLTCNFASCTVVCWSIRAVGLCVQLSQS